MRHSLQGKDVKMKKATAKKAPAKKGANVLQERTDKVICRDGNTVRRRLLRGSASRIA